ncbi:MAG TPA: Rne/Rng family ribonuclease [Solirubrobacterales bacterium]|nr:Rne/Rng family ribonuclease [Solirubrobacterales bacterium]
MKKTIVVSADRGETRVAVLEAKTVKSQREVAEVYIERRGGRSLVGNIYLGKVDNVLPGMEAAFVDIGLERNGFLHVDEILLPDGQQAPKRGRGQGRRIDELIKPKQEILVQVIKDPIKSKGARLSMNVTIAGRYLVYAPSGSGVGVSRRLADKERERLRRMVGRTYDGPGGLIVRTAAHGAKKADFVREIAYLHRLNEVLDKRKEGVKAPSLVFQEQDLPVRVLRDVFLNEFDRAIIDDQKQFDRVTSFFQRTAPELVELVEIYEGAKPLFEKWEIEKAIQSTLGRRINLPSGGYLIIDYTEALTVIDVNSGSFTGRGKGGLEETITRVNNEAAAEVVRQLRLRDIGGIIVIDFIDMAKGKNRDKVLGTLRGALDADKSKSYLVEISPLGLVEMTRQNITDGVREILTVKCPTCDGDGVVLSAETVALEGLRKMQEIAHENPSDEAFLIRVHPKVAALLNHPDSGLAELEAECGKEFHFEGGEALSIDNFELIESGEKAKIQERALPFRPEEEVFVKIEEPHMYNADDAIARIDSYIISVTGAAGVVGERKLVKIESVERAAAVATLLPEADQPEDTSKKAESPKPGRNRRGGGGNGGNGGSGSNGRSGGGGRAKSQRTKADDGKSEPGGASSQESDPESGKAGKATVKAENPGGSGSQGTEDEKSVNSGRFGLRRGRRRRGRKSKTDADS